MKSVCVTLLAVAFWSGIFAASVSYAEFIVTRFNLDERFTFVHEIELLERIASATEEIARNTRSTMTPQFTLNPCWIATSGDLIYYTASWPMITPNQFIEVH